MQNDRAIIPFPSDTIRLNGILQDTLSTIRCATSNLTYKEYLRVSSTLLFVVDSILVSALKSLRAEHTIGFETPKAIYYVEKNIGSVSEDMVLTALFITSIEKTFQIYSKIELSSDVQLTAEKSFAQLQNELSFLVDTNFSLEKNLSVSGALRFDFIALSASTEKPLTYSNSILSIENALNLVVEKYSGKILSTSELSMSVNASLARFRKLSDIDGLKFGDIDGWSMEVFDKIDL